VYTVFNEFSSFHLTENYAVDIMHDLLDGVCKYDIGLMLNQMIFSFKYFTLKTLNDRIKSFNYGTIDIRSRPPLFFFLLFKKIMGSTEHTYMYIRVVQRGSSTFSRI